MNGNVFYIPSGSPYSFPSESRLSSDFTANHFLFVEVTETKAGFSDSAINPTTQGQYAKIAERHQGYGYIACMDGHVIKMNETRFDMTRRTKAEALAGPEEYRNEYLEARWTP
jgi:hypothetical protein